MKRNKLLILAILMLMSVSLMFAEDFTIHLVDSWGDGWNGGMLDVTVAGTLVLDDITIASGSNADYTFAVNDGDEVVVDYTAGSYPGENSYTIDNNVGDEVYTSDPAADYSFTAVVITVAFPFPTDLVATNITQTTADLSWVAGDTETSWEVEYGVAGFTQTEGTTVTANTNSDFEITGLSAGLEYDFYVRGDYGEGNYSDWAGPESFTTAYPLISTLPYNQGFEGSDEDWTVIDANGDGDEWDLDYTTNPNSGSEVAMIYTDFNSGSNDDYLISPQIALTGNERLKFWVRVRSSGEPNDFEILLSEDEMDVADFSETLLVNSSYSNTTYEEHVIDLSAYTGNVYIAFHVPSDGLDGWRLYIDDVTIEEIPNDPIFAIDPESKDFGALIAGNTTDAQTFTISNIGGGSLDITSGNISITGTDAADFTLSDDNTYPIELGAGESTTVDVTFAPGSAGDKVANLTITDNRAVTNIPLTGTALPADYVFEGFETSVPPASWGNDSWSRSTSTVYEGDGAAYQYPYSTTQYTIYTPLLDIENGDVLSFVGRSSSVLGTIDVSYSADGENWTLIENVTYSATNTWEMKEIDLTVAAGNNYIGFRTNGSSYISYYLDNVIHPPAVVLPPEVATSPYPADEAEDVQPAVDLTWTNGFGTETVNLYFGTNNPPITQVSTGTLIDTYNPTLSYSETYYWRVDGVNAATRAVTTGDVWSFTVMDDPTIYTLPWLEDFTEYLPTNWVEAKGELTADTEFTSASSNWTDDGFANDGTDGAAKMNIYSTGRFEWLFTPPVDLGTTRHDYDLFFDVAYTDFGNGNAPESVGDDDKFAVVISTDGGETWSSANALQIWDNTTDPLLADISHTGQTVQLDLSSYSGIVQFGFYAESTVTNADNDLSIDNVQILDLQIPTIASEPNPENGAVNVDITPTLEWTNNYSIIDSTVVYFGEAISREMVAIDTLTNGETSVTYDGTLDYLTDYEWKVVNYNSVGGNSATAATWSFTTVGSTPSEPINPSPSDGDSGVELYPTLTWESSNADSFLVYYKISSALSFSLADTVYSTSYTFTEALDYGETYQWKIEAGNENGSINSSTWSFNTIVPEVFPFNEDFEGDVSSWVMEGTNSSWEIDTPSLTARAVPQRDKGDLRVDYYDDPTSAYEGMKCAGNDLTDDGLYNNNENSYLESPPIDCTEQATVLVEFYRWLNVEQNWDEAYFEVSIDAGLTWTSLGHPQYVQDNEWTNVSINATEQVAGEVAIFRWRIDTDGSAQKTGWNIDDISVGVLPAPSAATEPTPEDVAINVSINPTLTWTNNGEVDSTLVWFDGVIVDTIYTGSSYSISDLDYETAYNWKVVNYNMSGDNSATAETWTFTTEDAVVDNMMPVDGEDMCFEYIYFEWDAITGIDSYNIYVGTTEGGTDVINGENVTTSYYENTDAFELGQTYYWYVESVQDDARTVLGTTANMMFQTAPADYYTQGFEGTFPPDGWTNDSWSSSTTEHTQDKAAYRYGSSAQEDTLTSPRLDFSIGDGTEEMSFYWKSFSSDDTDSLIVVFNNGTTLDTLGVLIGEDSDWHKQVYTLTSTSDECYVEFRLFAPASDGDNYYIDDVVLPNRWYPAVSFELAPASQAEADDPGNTVTYEYSITNTGGDEDTYDITFGSEDNWITSATPNPITVASGATETFTISVDIPAEATEDEAHTDSLIVTSQALDTVLEVATAITTPHTMDIYEENNDFASAYEFTLAASRALSWTSDATTEVYPVDDVDFYMFNGTAGQVVTFNMNIEGSLNGGIVLYNSAQEELVDVSDDSSGSRTFTYTLEETGTYYIEAGYYYDVPSVTGRNTAAEEAAEIAKYESAGIRRNRASTGDYILEVISQDPAEISVTPASIATTVEYNQSGSELLNVANIGEVDLLYSSNVAPSSTYLDEGFESGLGSFTDESIGEWAISTDYYHSGAQSIHNAYDANSDDKIVTTDAIDLTGISTAKLNFWHIPYLEGSFYDNGYVEISTDGGTSWTELESYNKNDCDPVPSSSTDLTNDAWINSTIDLSSYEDETILIRFRLESDGSVQYAGWVIDDILVYATPTWLTLTDASDTIAGGENVDITLNFDATGMDAGTYEANVVVSSNGGDDVTVPVTLTVNDFNAVTPANIAITESAGTFTLTWEAVTGANSYYVYYATSPDAATEEWTVEQVNTNEFTYSGSEAKLFFKVTSSDAEYSAPVIRRRNATRK